MLSVSGSTRGSTQAWCGCRLQVSAGLSTALVLLLQGCLTWSQSSFISGCVLCDGRAELCPPQCDTATSMLHRGDGVSLMMKPWWSSAHIVSFIVRALSNPFLSLEQQSWMKLLIGRLRCLQMFLYPFSDPYFVTNCYFGGLQRVPWTFWFFSLFVQTYREICEIWDTGVDPRHN